MKEAAGHAPFGFMVLRSFREREDVRPAYLKEDLDES